MILRCCINSCTNKCYRILAACLYIVSAAANLHSAILTCINLTHMKMCLWNRLTSLNKTNYNLIDVMTNLIQLFYLKSAVKQLFFKLLRCYINIYIFFKPT